MQTKVIPKVEFSFLLGLIIYIIISSIIFAKNPYDIITDNNEGLSILLMLFGGFLIVLLMFFYSRKKELFEYEKISDDPIKIEVKKELLKDNTINIEKEIVLRALSYRDYRTIIILFKEMYFYEN